MFEAVKQKIKDIGVKTHLTSKPEVQYGGEGSGLSCTLNNINNMEYRQLKIFMSEHNIKCNYNNDSLPVNTHLLTVSMVPSPPIPTTTIKDEETPGAVKGGEEGSAPLPKMKMKSSSIDTTDIKTLIFDRSQSAILFLEHIAIKNDEQHLMPSLHCIEGTCNIMNYLQYATELSTILHMWKCPKEAISDEIECYLLNRIESRLNDWELMLSNKENEGCFMMGRTFTLLDIVMYPLLTEINDNSNIIEEKYSNLYKYINTMYNRSSIKEAYSD